MIGHKPFLTVNEITLGSNRDILLVIDDVWNKVHLEPFLQGGPRCARLITTRNLDTLPVNAQPVIVDAMQPGEAVELLSVGLSVRSTGFSRNASDIELLPPEVGTTNELSNELRTLAARLGEWPLLLKLVNGTLRDRANTANQAPMEALGYINQALDKRGLKFFDARDPAAREQAVEKTISVSLERLNNYERARYFELAVFPEDTDVPLATLERYWRLDEFDTETLCERFHKLSLLLNFDLSTRTILLHDVLRKYLMDKRRNRLKQLHQKLLDNHAAALPLPHAPTPAWSTLPDAEPYLWDHLAFYLIEGVRGAELVATVKDWRYLAQRTFLRKSHAVENDLLQAEAIAPTNNQLHRLRRNFVKSSHLFNRCVTRKEVVETLFVRLQHLEDLTAILQDLEQCLERPHINSRSGLPDLSPTARVRTLEGHSDRVRNCAYSPDSKQIVSASYDGTLKIWDADGGWVLRTLKGHSREVRDCAYSPDSKQIVSASDDRTLKVWDADSGQLLLSLERHSDEVTGCAYR